MKLRRGEIRLRFGIRSLLLFAAMAAVGCALYVAARNAYYAERLQVQSVLARVEGIGEVTLHSHIDIGEEINATSVSVDGIPDSILVLEGLSRYQDAGSFSLSRIGKWRFGVSGRRHIGAYSEASGEPVESEYFGAQVEFGANSPYNSRLPFAVRTLQDLVDHYQALVDALDSWPREDQAGAVTLDDGSTQYYWVIEDPLPPRHNAL